MMLVSPPPPPPFPKILIWMKPCLGIVRLLDESSQLTKVDKPHFMLLVGVFCVIHIRH